MKIQYNIQSKLWQEAAFWLLSILDKIQYICHDTNGVYGICDIWIIVGLYYIPPAPDGLHLVRVGKLIFPSRPSSAKSQGNLFGRFSEERTGRFSIREILTFLYLASPFLFVQRGGRFKDLTASHNSNNS